MNQRFKNKHNFIQLNRLELRTNYLELDYSFDNFRCSSTSLIQSFNVLLLKLSIFSVKMRR
jgi:hypothetical protein